MKALSRQAAVLAAVLLLLIGQAAARQLDAVPEHSKQDKDEMPQQASGLSHSHRSLSWGHADRQDGRAEDRYQGYERRDAHFSQYQGYDNEQTVRDGQHYERGYDRQYTSDGPYRGEQQDSNRGYDRGYERGYDRDYDRMEQQSHDRAGSRDAYYQEYRSQKETGQQRFDEEQDRQYIQYDSYAHGSDRSREYQGYGDRDQGRWQEDSRPWQHDGAAVHPYYHSHGAVHDEGSAAANATAAVGSCAQHHPTAEEASKFQGLLGEAAQWWDDFREDVEVWLEDHGNVVYEWLGDKLSGLFNDSSSRQDNTAAASTFNARVKVYWITVLPQSGTINGHDGRVLTATVNKQIQVLNAAYKSAGFLFVLESFRVVRRIDAEFTGCTEDVDPNTARVKRAYRKGFATDLYIYTWLPTCKTWEPLGWATFPDQYTRNPLFDGVVMIYTTLPGGTNANNLGNTGVHEVGHWLGLYHVFEGRGTCDDQVNDGVDDTPVQLYSMPGCPATAPDTCPNQQGRDSIHNYMHYSDDICMNEFTPGQIKRMQNAWKLRVRLSQQTTG